MEPIFASFILHPPQVYEQILFLFTFRQVFLTLWGCHLLRKCLDYEYKDGWSRIRDAFSPYLWRNERRTSVAERRRESWMNVSCSCVNGNGVLNLAFLAFLAAEAIGQVLSHTFQFAKFWVTAISNKCKNTSFICRSFGEKRTFGEFVNLSRNSQFVNADFLQTKLSRS